MDGVAEDQIVKHDALGRVSTSRERREALLDEFERSGLKGAQFARAAGVNYQTFAAWVQRRRHARGDYSKRRGIGALPTGSAGDSPVNWIEAVAAAPMRSTPVSATAADALQVSLPSGAHLTISTPQQAALAAQLLNALRPSC
jgi:hypothetical protein